MIWYASALAPLVPIISAALIPVVSRLSGKARDYLSVFAASSTLFLTILMIPGVFSSGQMVTRYSLIPGTRVDIVVVIDALSMLMANIASFLGLFAVLYSLEYMKDENGLTRYYSFVLLFIGSMIGLVTSGNLLQLYVFWELVSVCSFFLIGFRYKKPSAVKAATKAFLVTHVGSLCLLVGMLWMFNYTHTFDLVTISGLIGEVPFTVLQACSLLFLLGAMSKSAQLPFQIWLPDAMEAPTPVSALIHAATMVNAGVYLVARVSPLFSSVSVFFTLAMYVGILTAFLAATMALVTDDIKRLLAYSTISQLGYVMFILGMRSSLAYFAGVFHMFNHALFKALLFLCAGAVIHGVHTRDMNRMGGLWRIMPVTFVMSLGGAMALGGLPPFNGFFSKELILEATESAGHPYLVAVVVVTSALTFAYSLRLVSKVFLSSKRKPIHASKTPLLMTVCLRVLGATCIFSVLSEQPLIGFFNRSGLISEGVAVIPYSGIHPVPLVSSVGALALGLSAFLLRKPIVQFLTTHNPLSKIIGLISHGYGFDRVCNILSQLTISLAVTLSEKRYFDQSYNALGRLTSLTASSLSKKRFVDRFFDTLGRLTVAAASGVRKMQTGILGWNIRMMIVGVMGVILLTVILG
ncbi:MAG: NADH-quinone oxidoreductase subunit L [Candidatus Bathyarchaeota archaeon]|nr:NADH-quinone oxidoreductase subunit L [Candidatus Bathyarchaeota archaeon]